MILPLFRPPRGPILKSPAPGKLYYGHLYDDDELLDEVLLAFFPPDSSLTGSEMVEINCHGGIAPANAVIQALVRRGAADADPQDLFRASVDSGSSIQSRPRQLSSSPTPPASRPPLFSSPSIAAPFQANSPISPNSSPPGKPALPATASSNSSLDGSLQKSSSLPP